MPPTGPNVDAIIASISLDTKVAEQQIRALEKRAVEAGKIVSKSLSDGMARGITAGVSNFVTQLRQNQTLKNIAVRIKLEPIITKVSVEESLRKLRSGTPFGRIDVPVGFKNLKSAVKDLQTQVSNSPAIRVRVEFDKAGIRKEVQQVAEGIKILPLQVGLQTNSFNIGTLAKNIQDQLRKTTIVATPQSTAPFGGRGGGGAKSEDIKTLELKSANIRRHIQDINEEINDIIKNTNTLFKGVGGGISSITEDAKIKLSNIGKVIESNTARIIQTGKTGKQIFGTLLGSLTGKDPLATAGGNVERIAQARRQELDIINGVADGLRQAALNSAQLIESFSKGLSVVEGLGREVGELQDKLKATNDRLKDLNSLTGKGDSDIKKTEELQEQERLLKEQLDTTIKLREEAQRSLGVDTSKVKLEAQGLIGTSISTGEGKITPNVLSVAARGETFEQGLVKERARLRESIRQETETRLLSAEAINRNISVTDIDSKTRIRIIDQSRAEVQTRSVLNKIEKQEEQLRQRLIAQLAKEIDEGGGVTTPFGQQVNVRQPGVSVTDAGKAFDIDPQQSEKLRDLEKQFDQNIKKIEEARQASAVLGKTTEATIRVIDKQTGAVLINERAYFKYGRQVGDIINLQGRAAAFTQNLGNQMFTAAQKVAQWSVATGILFQSVRAIRSLIQVATDVNLVMAEMRTVLNPVTTDFDALQATATQFALKFGVSIKDAGNSMVEFARQGLDVNEVIKATEAALILSNVSTLSQADSAKQLTAVMKQLDIAVNDLLPHVDAITAVSAAFAVEAGDLTQGISRSGAAARAVGVDFNELISIVAVVGEATQRAGREVGNAFRTIFARALAKDSIAALEDLGIEVLKTGGEVASFTEIIDKLAGKWGDLTDIQKVNIAQLLGGKRRYNEVLALLNNYDRFIEANVISTNSLNDAQFKNQQILNSYAKTVEVTKASLQSLALVFSEGGLLTVLEVFNKLVQASASGLGSINSATSGLAGAALFGATAAPAAIGAGGFLANTLGILPPGSPQQSTVQKISARDFFTQMRAIQEESTSKIVSAVAAVDKSIDEQTAKEVALRRQGLTSLTGGPQTSRGFFATIAQRRAAGGTALGAIVPAVGSGIRATGGRLLAGGAALLASGGSAIAIAAVVAGIGLLVSVIVKLIQNLTSSSEDILKDEEQKLTLLSKQREAVITAVQASSGIKLTSGGQVVATGAEGPSRLELNSIARRTAEIGGLPSNIRPIVDEAKNIKLGFGIARFASDAENAEKAITNLNNVLDDLESQSAKLNLEAALDASTDKFHLFKTVSIEGLGDIETSSENVEEALREISKGNIKTDKFKEAFAGVREEFEVLRKQINASTQQLGIAELIGDPNTAVQATEVLTRYGERISTLTLETGQLQDSQEKLAAGFRQVFGEILQKSGSAIHAVDGVFDSKTIQDFANGLSNTDFDNAGNEISESLEHVIFVNGRMVDAQKKLSRSFEESEEELRSRLRPELIGFIDDQERNRRVLASTVQDVFGNIVILNEYGEVLQTTHEVLKRFTLTGVGFGSQLVEQSDSLTKIVEDFERFKGSLESISKGIEAISSSAQFDQSFNDFFEQLGTLSSTQAFERNIAPLNRSFERIKQLTVGGTSLGQVDLQKEGQDVARAVESYFTAGNDAVFDSLSGLRSGSDKNQISGIIKGAFDNIASNIKISKDLNLPDIERSGGFDAINKIAGKAIEGQIAGVVGAIVSNVASNTKFSGLGKDATISNVIDALVGQELIPQDLAETFTKILKESSLGDLRGATLDILKSGLDIDEATIEDPAEVVKKAKDSIDGLANGFKESGDNFVSNITKFRESLSGSFDKLSKLGATTATVDLFNLPDAANQFETLNRGFEDLINKAIEAGEIEWAQEILKAADATVQLNQNLRETVNSMNQIITSSLATGFGGGASQIAEQVLGKVDEAQQAIIGQLFTIAKNAKLAPEDFIDAIQSGNFTSIKSKLAASGTGVADQRIFAETAEDFKILLDISKKESQKVLAREERVVGRRLEGRPPEAAGFETALKDLKNLIQGAESQEDLGRRIEEFFNAPGQTPGRQALGGETRLLELLEENALRTNKKILEETGGALVEAAKIQQIISNMQVTVMTVDKINGLEEAFSRVFKLRDIEGESTGPIDKIARVLELSLRDEGFSTTQALEQLGIGKELAATLEPVINKILAETTNKEGTISPEGRATIASVIQAGTGKQLPFGEVLGREFKTANDFVKEAGKQTQNILGDIQSSIVGIVNLTEEGLSTAIQGLNVDEETKAALISKLAPLIDVGEGLRDIVGKIAELRRVAESETEGERTINTNENEDAANRVQDELTTLQGNFERLFNRAIKNLPKESVGQIRDLGNVIAEKISSTREQISSARTPEEVDKLSKSIDELVVLFGFIKNIGGGAAPQIGLGGATLGAGILETLLNKESESKVASEGVINASKILGDAVLGLNVNEETRATGTQRLTDAVGLFANAVHEFSLLPFREESLPLPFREHSGSLNLNRPDEFNAILQRGEAVIPRHLTSLLPTDITSQIPRFHQGVLDFGNNQFGSKLPTFPQEISEAFVNLAESIKDVGSVIEEKSTRDTDSEIINAIHLQSELLVNVVAELRVMNQQGEVSGNENIATILNSILETLNLSQRIDINSRVAEFLDRPSDRGAVGKSEILLSLSPNTKIPITVEVGQLPPGLIERAVAQHLSSNPDLLLELVRSTPIAN